MTAAAASPSVRFDPPLEDRIGRITISRPDDSVNAINAELVEALADAVRVARAESDSLRGLILVSDKPNQWVAGADLKMVEEALLVPERIRL